MTRDVFISYSTRDAQTATAVCSQLEASGIHCWIAPRDMDVGGQTSYGATIVEAISNSSMMVVILSHHSAGSVQVIREVERAVAKGIPILPFQIDEMVLSADMEFFLSATHRLDASKGPLSQHVNALLQRIRQLRPSSPNPVGSHDQALPASLPRMQGKRRNRQMRWLVLGLLAVPLAVFAWLILQRNGTSAAVKSATAPAGERGSLAVLPFVNMSDDKSNEYFSDGITEETLNAIAKLPGLRVASRTSSFSFKGQNLPIDSIAQRLRVAHVLEGSVRKSGQRVKITAQLIDARTDEHLWSDEYDRDLKDVFAVQAEIARAIARALEIEFSGVLQGTPPTNSMRAHDLYLLGLNDFNGRTRAGLQRSIQNFEAAIEEDSAYAQAWTGLALVHATQSLFDPRVSSLESARLARVAATRALELDSTLALPHAALGWALGRLEWKWKESEAELRRAVRMGPNDLVAHAWLAHVLLPLGRRDEALEHMNVAIRLDPVSAYAHMARGILLYHSGRQDEGAAEFRLARSFEPDNATLLNQLTRFYLVRGQYDSARFTMRRSAELAGFTRLHEIDEFTAAMQAQNFTRARQLLAGWEGAFADYYLALQHLAAHDREGAIRLLGRSLRKREPSLTILRVDADLAVLHDDPRVIAILKRLGL